MCSIVHTITAGDGTTSPPPSEYKARSGRYCGGGRQESCEPKLLHEIREYCHYCGVLCGFTFDRLQWYIILPVVLMSLLGGGGEPPPDAAGATAASNGNPSTTAVDATASTPSAAKTSGNSSATGAATKRK